MLSVSYPHMECTSSFCICAEDGAAMIITLKYCERNSMDPGVGVPSCEPRTTPDESLCTRQSPSNLMPGPAGPLDIFRILSTKYAWFGWIFICVTSLQSSTDIVCYGSVLFYVSVQFLCGIFFCMYSFDNLSSSLGSISSALVLPVSPGRHRKLLDNFSIFLNLKVFIKE